MADQRTEMIMQAWVRLIRAHDRVVANVEAAMKSAGLPTLAWYDVLLELSRDGGRRLRPVELERELLVAQYNLSRLLDRMVEAELVQREPCDGDGRGQVVSLTAKGKAMQKEMWPHLRQIVIKEMTVLKDGDLDKLGKLLTPLSNWFPRKQ
jgi:DNA-binding MarR family transcriptional regulator